MEDGRTLTFFSKLIQKQNSLKRDLSLYDLALEDKEILDFKKLFKFQSHQKYDTEQPQTYNYNNSFVPGIGLFHKVKT